MCCCALVAPCALWYEYYAKNRYCCTHADVCCLELQVMALDDIDLLCCCVDLPLRYQLFDVDWWCPQWASEVATQSAVVGHGVPEAHVPDAIIMA